MAEQIFYQRGNNHLQGNGRNAEDPLFRQDVNNKTSAQIISEAKASVYHKNPSNQMVRYFNIYLSYKNEICFLSYLKMMTISLFSKYVQRQR